jgi:hypothetical protein
MEFYSVMKKNEILSFAGEWMELENIIWSEGPESQRQHFFLSYVEYRPKRRKLRKGIWLMHFLYKNGYRIFKPVEITIKKETEKKQKVGRGGED